MRRLIAIASAVLLTACAATAKQPVPVAAHAGSGIIVVGTLSLGPCEMSLGADYTRTKVVLEKTTRRLEAHRISAPQAKVIADKGAALLAALDAICPLEKDGRLGDAWGNRDFVKRALPELESLPGDAK